ncbi:MAG: hypothetical protein PF590_08310, partial [Candidatus Delongbacteria bacterium]|nr:hypothetical protein [Candidatus Delongbacteria bacterium]
MNILPGKMVENKPLCLQNGSKIESQYEVSDDTIMFNIAEYNTSKPLIIDPSLTWSTYFYDNTTSTAFTYTNPVWDSNGNMFIVLNTYNETSFPVIDPGGSTYYQSTGGDNGIQLVIMKFNTNRQIIWSTYYAGSQSTKTKYSNQSVAIDQKDNLYIIGSVFYVYGSPSPSFPLYDQGSGAYYETEQGNNRNFILKFSSAGVRLWATMFNKTSGSSSSGLELSGIAIDNNNELLVSGGSYTPPSWNPMPLKDAGGSHYYVSNPGESETPTLHRFSESGVFEWGTYISRGNSGTYCGDDSFIAVDESNNIFLTSAANSSYSTVNPGGAYTDGSGGSGRKVSIFKFLSTGALNWCTLYGGSSSANSIIWQDPRDIEIASNGDVVIVGRVNTTDFPTYDPGGGAYVKTTLSSGSTFVCDGIILQFSNSGARKWATYYGGDGTSDGSEFWGLGISTDNYITASGITRSSSFPCKSKTGSYNQSSITGSKAIVFAQFDINGVREWASYFGDETYYSSGGFAVKEGLCGESTLMQCGTANNSYSFPTQDPGGGAYYNATTESGTSTDVFIELSDGSAGSGGTPGVWGWIGTVNNDWFEPCNWDKYSVPSSTSPVVIPG